MNTHLLINGCISLANGLFVIILNVSEAAKDDRKRGPMSAILLWVGCWILAAGIGMVIAAVVPR